MFKPDDWSVERLRQMFRLSHKYGLQSIFFGEENNKTNYVLWRHDVDLDLHAALIHANIEAEEEIKSTFFFMTNSNFYNLFSKEGFKIVEQIINMGHRVGLHCDLGVERNISIGEMEIEEIVKKNYFLLDHMFGTGVFEKIVSFHNPPNCVQKISFSFYSTYQEKFFSEIKYLSESNRSWMEGSPDEWFQKNEQKKYSILLHPIIWNTKGKTMADAAQSFIELRQKWLINKMEEDDIRIK